MSESTTETVSMSREVIKICTDFESVPDQRQLDIEYGNCGDFEAAREAAHLPNGNERTREILGDAFKPGPRKGDTLVAFITEFEREFEAKTCKALAVSPLRCALCSVSIYIEPIIDGAPRPVAFRGSWGTTRSGDEVIEVLGREVTVKRLPMVDEAKPLGNMTYEEQLAAERNLLLWTWHVLSTYRQALADRRATFVTFNGENFDVPALRMRTMMHCDPILGPNGKSLQAVRPTVDLVTARYQNFPHMDISRVLDNHGPTTYTSLEKGMSYLGVPFLKPDGWNGAKVYPAAMAGDWDGIESYNLADAVTLHAAADKMIRGGLVR